MSAQRLSSWPCLHSALGYGVFLLVTLLDFTTGKNCSHPMLPEHGGFRCEPSPCRGFPHKSSIYYFCEPGYKVPFNSSRCRHGRWIPSVPTCIPDLEGRGRKEKKAVNSLPNVATTAVGVSIFLLTTTACMIVKSRLYPCQSHSRRSSNQMDLMVDGLSVCLPTYEEAVYGSWGQRLGPTSGGPTQLLLAQDASGHEQLSSLIQSDSRRCTDVSNHSTDVPPPPYEEVQSRSREAQDGGDQRTLQITLSVDKDN